MYFNVAGGVLHVHDFSMTSIQWVVKNITYMSDCYMCIDSNDILQMRFSARPPKEKGKGYLLTRFRFITARKRSLRRLFLHLSVILFRGGRAWQGGCMWWGGMHGRGGVCGRGCACWGRGMRATHARYPPPPRHYEIRSVNGRAVRIILECILVVNSKYFTHMPYKLKYLSFIDYNC